MVKTNNQYLKDIDESVKGETVSGVHTDNYYLKEISENIGTGGGGSGVVVDSELSTTSTNPVQNKVITDNLNSKVGSVDLDTLELVITYQDSTTETVNITKWSD